MSNGEFMSPLEQTTSPDEKLVPLMTRLPESLHAWIRETAKRERRSLNAQIVILLQQSKEQSERTDRTP
jgi:hypothetical protein